MKCQECGKRIRKAWRREGDNVFCNRKCYHKWRQKHYIAKGQKQDWSAHNKLKRLALMRQKLMLGHEIEA